MLRIDHLTVGYEKKRPLFSTHLEFEPGSVTAIVGENGSGKTSLLQTIAGRLRPLAGELSMDNATLKSKRVA